MENRIDPLSPQMSSESLNPEYASEGPSDQQEVAVGVQLCEPLLYRGSDDDSVSGNSEILPVVSDTDEDSDSLPYSERLCRARAGKKKVGFYALGHNPGLEADANTEAGPGSGEETRNILVAAPDMSDVYSVLDELAQSKFEFTLPEPALQSEGESISGDAPSITDEYPSAREKMSGYEADVSDAQISASEHALGGRTRRRSPHSRLATPLGMYATSPRKSTVG